MDGKKVSADTIFSFPPSLPILIMELLIREAERYIVRKNIQGQEAN